MIDGTITGNYAQMQKYAQLGKEVEKAQMMKKAIAEVTPMIEKEAVRKYAPVIADQAKDEAIIKVAEILAQARSRPTKYLGNGNGLAQTNKGMM